MNFGLILGIGGSFYASNEKIKSFNYSCNRNTKNGKIFR